MTEGTTRTRDQQTTRPAPSGPNSAPQPDTSPHNSFPAQQPSHPPTKQDDPSGTHHHEQPTPDQPNVPPTSTTLNAHGPGLASEHHQPTTANYLPRKGHSQRPRASDARCSLERR